MYSLEFIIIRIKRKSVISNHRDYRNFLCSSRLQYYIITIRTVSQLSELNHKNKAKGRLN